MRLTPFDFLIIAVLVYLLVRMVLRKRGGQGRDTRPGDGSSAPRQHDPDTRRQANEAYRRAQAAWDMLRSDGEPTAQSRTDAPQGFDEQEFLAGAKMMCARIRESWDARDLADLEAFCTPAALAEFKRRAETETRPVRTETLLINAELVEIRPLENGMEEAQVLYEILDKAPGSNENRESREIWRFVRPSGDPAAMWRLEAQRPVDEAGKLTQ